MNNFFLSCKECVLEGPRHFYGCFYLGPFNSSQSLTVGNALRRTLLSEISGLGIVNVEIEGVKHEYSTFLGVRESVLDILLNLKEIVLCYDNLKFNSNLASENKANSNLSSSSSLANLTESKITEPSFGESRIGGKKENLKQKYFQGYLQVNGPGIIRASDLKLPFGLSCVDSDQYIATLSENGKLNLKFLICESHSSYYKQNENSFKVHFKGIRGTKSNAQPSSDHLNGTEKSTQQMQETKSWAGSMPILKGSENEHPQKTFPVVQKNDRWGFGQSPAGQTLKVDPVFSPIKKVNYTIQSYGVLQNSNSQVIFLELWTNGSIHPRNALYKALNVLSSTFSNLEKMKVLNDIYIKSLLKSDTNYSKLMKKTSYNFNSFPPSEFRVADQNQPNKAMSWALGLAHGQGSKLPEPVVNHLSERSPLSTGNRTLVSTFDQLKSNYSKKEQYLNKYMSIRCLNLPFRIENCLEKANILTLNDLFNKPLNELKQVPGLGNQSMKTLQKKMHLFLSCSP